MGDAGAIRRVSRVLNIVHNDEIWKDHVQHETLSARQRWPETWGYLVREYNELNLDLEGKPTRSFGGLVTTSPAEGLKLPKIPDRQRGYPRTTSQEIGWKSTQDGHNAEMMRRIEGMRRGKRTFIRRLKWPNTGVY